MLPVNVEINYDFIGFVHGLGILFVGTNEGLFSVDVKSHQVRKICGGDCCDLGMDGVVPYMGFYTPDLHQYGLLPARTKSSKYLNLVEPDQFWEPGRQKPPNLSQIASQFSSSTKPSVAAGEDPPPQAWSHNYPSWWRISSKRPSLVNIVRRGNFISTFVPTASFQQPCADRVVWQALDSRHGR
ncbi:hypothetical protein EJB05_14112, partial [Eragrostis curvula]